MSIIKHYRYEFPPSNMTYDIEDLPIISRIATLLHYSSDKYFKWSVRDKKPYIVYFYGPTNDDLYWLYASLEGHFECNFVTWGKKINDKEIIMRELDSIIEKDIELRDKTYLDLTISRPATDEIDSIGDYLEDIWDIIWNKYNGELPNNLNSNVKWIIYNNEISLLSIDTEDCIFNFSKDLFYFVTDEADAHEPYRYVFTEREADEEAVDICEPFLIEWIEKAVSMYYSIYLDNEWHMETDCHNSYIQWLPREVLEDIKELI